MPTQEITSIKESCLESLLKAEEVVSGYISAAEFILKPNVHSYELHFYICETNRFFHDLIVKNSIEITDLPLSLRFNSDVYLANFKKTRHCPQKYIKALHLLIKDFENISEFEEPGLSVYRNSLKDVLSLLQRELSLCCCREEDFERFMAENWEDFIQKIHRRFGRGG